jgi:type I restriction enzyme R subunit
VRIAREVFCKGDDFCQKITYRATGLPENLISAFRTSYNPRIAVTVDMIATGTDIKPLEALLFMRAVRSRVLFEQMLGRGTRIISETDFQAVTTTPNAHKTRFVIVDAVGVTEQELIDTGTVERKRSVPLKSLLDAVALGAVDDDVLGSLARRLGLLEKRLSTAQRQEVENMLDIPTAPERFTTLQALSNALLDAIDPDRIQERAVRDGADPTAGLTEQETEAARQKLVQRAIVPLEASPNLRSFLLEREILIDETSLDEVLLTEFDRDATTYARQLVESFQQFIQQHKDEITALQILFSRPYAQRHLDFAQVRQLAEHLNQDLKGSDPLYMTETLWRAYQQLEKDHVRGAGERRVLTDLVSLVRHAALDKELVPFPERVEQHYQEWLGVQANSGRQYTPQERWWLDEIARHIGINVSINVEDLNYYGFQNRGGQVAALRLFGAKLPVLLEELNSALSE